MAMGFYIINGLHPKLQRWESMRLKRGTDEITGGYDGRYPEQEDKPDLSKMREWLYKKRVLSTLENPMVAERDKMRIIHEYEYYKESSKYITNLCGGGLDNPFEY
jgi:hypothetical protein